MKKLILKSIKDDSYGKLSNESIGKIWGGTVYHTLPGATVIARRDTSIDNEDRVRGDSPGGPDNL